MKVLICLQKFNIKFFFRQVLKSVKVGFSLRTGSSEFQSLKVCPVVVLYLTIIPPEWALSQ